MKFCLITITIWYPLLLAVECQTMAHYKNIQFLRRLSLERSTYFLLRLRSGGEFMIPPLFFLLFDFGEISLKLKLVKILGHVKKKRYLTKNDVTGVTRVP